MHNRKAIVLTPVKNEAHILESFLKLTSLFADAIIIADQGSSDCSIDIANQFDNVTVVINDKPLFNNAARAELLINKARDQFGLNNFLLALDADELLIPSAEALTEIRGLIKLNLGTTVFFDKPTFYGSTARWIEYGPVFPLGYLDDGADYSGKIFHSRRIPGITGNEEYQAAAARFAHLDSMDLQAMLAKRRLYSVREKDANNTGIIMRWQRNSRLFIKNMTKLSTNVPPAVADVFLKNGIDINKLIRPEPYWWDLELLSRFKKNGCRTYWWEDIWYKDWRKFVLKYSKSSVIKNVKDIEYPPVWINVIRAALIRVIFYLLLFKKILRSIIKK